MTDGVDVGSKADLSVQRALAIVLMREVLPLLEALGEKIAAGHLQTAIDTVVGGAETLRTEGSC